VRSKLSPEPSRAPAYWLYGLAAVSLGGAAYLFTLEPENDPNMKGDFCDNDFCTYQNGAIVGAGLAGVFTLWGIYEHVKEKGKPSTGKVDVKAIAVSPTVTPNYAGIGLATAF
jgi:hypothetical protein